MKRKNPMQESGQAVHNKLAMDAYNGEDRAMNTLINMQGITKVYHPGDNEVRALDGIDLQAWCQAARTFSICSAPPT